MRRVLDDVPISIPLSILSEAFPGCVLEVLLEAFMHSVRLALVEVVTITGGHQEPHERLAEAAGSQPTHLIRIL